MRKSTVFEQPGFFWTEQLPLEVPPVCKEHGAHPDGSITCPKCATDKSESARQHVSAIENHDDQVASAVQLIRVSGDDAHVWTSGKEISGKFRVHLTPSKGSRWSFCDSEVVPGRTQQRKLTDIRDKRYVRLYCDDCLRRAGILRDRGR